MKKQPLENIKWVHRDTLSPNNYNPNTVQAPELALLKVSILEDGWTQPIVINPDNTIVDGFHRWTVSGHKEIYQLTGGKVPTVMIEPKDKSSQVMATIRHNRARGSHGVLKMSDLVEGMVAEGLTANEIMERVGMEKEEVVRLLFRSGIKSTDAFKDLEFSKSWTPK
jgi:ParB-like chromosome segregation protein Spo0J